jgi:hypothetical protein
LQREENQDALIEDDGFSSLANVSLQMCFADATMRFCRAYRSPCDFGTPSLATLRSFFS